MQGSRGGIQFVICKPDATLSD